MSHTPTPWHIFTKNWGFQIVSDDMPAEVIAVAQPESEADAEFIVRAVNSSEAYEELLEAAKAVKEWRSGNPDYADSSVVFGLLYDAIQKADENEK